jgi:hypothetical protein
LCTLHRYRPGPLPFKTTGIHIYEFGGCVKIWSGQLCVLSPVTDPVLFHSKQPEYIFMNLEVLYTAEHSHRENTLKDHRRDIHLLVHVIRSKPMLLSNTLEDHQSEPHYWSSVQTHKSTVIREFSRDHTKKCTTSTRHTQCTHHHSCRDPVCSCRQFPCYPLPPVIRVIVLFLFPEPTLTWFVCSKRFVDLFRVRNWGSMTPHVF